MLPAILSREPHLGPRKHTESRGKPRVRARRATAPGPLRAAPRPPSPAIPAAPSASVRRARVCGCESSRARVGTCVRAGPDGRWVPRGVRRGGLESKAAARRSRRGLVRAAATSWMRESRGRRWVHERRVTTSSSASRLQVGARGVRRVARPLCGLGARTSRAAEGGSRAVERRRPHERSTSRAGRARFERREGVSTAGECKASECTAGECTRLVSPRRRPEQANRKVRRWVHDEHGDASRGRRERASRGKEGEFAAGCVTVGAGELIAGSLCVLSSAEVLCGANEVETRISNRKRARTTSGLTRYDTTSLSPRSAHCAAAIILGLVCRLPRALRLARTPQLLAARQGSHMTSRDGCWTRTLPHANANAHQFELSCAAPPAAPLCTTGSSRRSTDMAPPRAHML